MKKAKAQDEEMRAEYRREDRGVNGCAIVLHSPVVVATLTTGIAGRARSATLKRVAT